ncbi:MAG: hypothetical protein Q4D04_02245, partial [Clostridia bacterium]|nr:hypothetical protein [Clostridia bacterium]
MYNTFEVMSVDREAKNLIKGRSMTLLIFEAVYKAFGATVIIPFCLWLINIGFKSVGISYISPANFAQILYPTVAVSAIAAALIMAVYTL